jgi:activating signal cointegrator complex subunit 3
MVSITSRLRELRGAGLDKASEARVRQERALQACLAATAARDDDFTWERFSAGSAPTADGWHEARAAFRELRAAVGALLGEETGGAQLGAALASIYAAASKVASRFPDPADARRARALRDALGGAVGASNVAPAEVERLVRTHAQLAAWRLAVGLGEAARPPPAAAGPPFGDGWRVQPRACWAELAPNRALLAAVLAALEAAAARAPARSHEPTHAAAPAPSAAPVEVGSVLWLRQSVQGHVDRPGAPRGVDGEALTAVALRLLVSDAADDSLQNELFDLLGFEGVELVTHALQARADVADSAVALCELALGGGGGGGGGGDGDGGGSGGGGGAYGTGVSVTSLSAQRAQRAARKEERRVSRRAGGAEGSAAAQLERLLLGLGLDQALQLAAEAALGEAGGGSVAAASGGHAASRHALPEGTVREVFAEFETVKVPPPLSDATRALAAARPRARVASLELLVRRVLGGVDSLNPMQTAVHKCALYSSENFLVCAPTGAGKTNVALMAICQQLLAAEKAGGAVDLAALKIVYIAPMKALAAEVAAKLGAALRPLALRVRELTGDMQLTKREIAETQLLVCTPEKWDVVTRKGSEGVGGLVSLLILDEVHLLGDDRGPVLEAIVARTLRQVESAQVQVRLLGLSATLPNYVDVGLFLRASPATGIFYFDASYRPVPLSTEFVGVKVLNPMRRAQTMLEIAYERVVLAALDGKQAMVFVHARNDTVRTARALRDLARNRAESSILAPDEAHARYAHAARDVGKSRSADLRELFASGLGVHHAGMLRAERSLAERLFAEGHLKCLVCTATLAWGVNLPAHTVIIKGTQVGRNKGAKAGARARAGRGRGGEGERVRGQEHGRARLRARGAREHARALSLSRSLSLALALSLSLSRSLCTRMLPHPCPHAYAHSHPPTHHPALAPSLPRSTTRPRVRTSSSRPSTSCRSSAARGGRSSTRRATA